MLLSVMPFEPLSVVMAEYSADDLAAMPIEALMERDPGVNWKVFDDIIGSNAFRALTGS